MGTQDRTVAAVMARIAGRSHGVVTRTQLLDAGLTARQIKRRVRAGALLRVHPGVYRVGHRAPSIEATYFAAVVAAGDGALLSGLAAAYLHGLVKGSPPPAEVTSRTQRRIEGTKAHRCRSLNAQDATSVRGIPVTTVPRTLVDLSSLLSLDELARACHEAGVRHRTTPAQVERALARTPRAKGAANLRRVLRGEVHVTLSKLERRFLALLREHGLPLPITNKRAGTKRVDCRWPQHHLTVELDSYTFHNSRQAWEQDRRRERQAHARGDQPRRYTHHDVTEEPAQMLRELRELLSAARSRSAAPSRRRRA
jgi:predicted transcriptional regulator of viral defense system